MVLDLSLIHIFVFACGALTVATDARGLYKAVSGRKRLAGYLPDDEDYGPWDLLTARIRSLDDYLAENVFMADELGYLNSSFQYALGKRCLLYTSRCV